jgi:hypothetical protein
MAIHTKEQFTAVVAGLNKAFDGLFTFQLVGSLKDKPASYHDADIVVYPHPAMPAGIQLEGFIKACKQSGAEIIEVDTDSTTPFPGRPDGQDRIKLKSTTGQIVELFFPKGRKKK